MRTASRKPGTASGGGSVTAWHALSPSDAARELGVDAISGLSATDVVERLARYGANEVRERPRRGPVRMFLDQFSDFMILVLLGAALLSGMVGDLKDTVAIIVIVVLNAVIGFVQEFRAERAIAALKKMAASAAVVIRGNERLGVSATDLVPGDIVVLEAGNVVPADLRLIEAAQLKVDEAMLTGESLTVEKAIDALPGADLPLGDRRLAAFSRRLALVVLAICALIFVVGLLRGEPVVLMFLTAVSLAVAAIPEALPALVTISLALGARKMVRMNALVRRLPAVETLGSVTYICTDKTGTLTQNRMRVEELWVAGRQRTDWWGEETRRASQALLHAVSLCNDAHLGRDGEVTGDPTETALLVAAREAGIDKARLDTAEPRLKELPFDSERKRMTTFHRHEGRVMAYTKGAPESVLERCRLMVGEDDQETSVSSPDVLIAAERMAAEGLRVLAVARKSLSALPEDSDAASLEQELVLLGLVGDPPRTEAADAVRLCQSAGITPVMITGDHLVTARAIGRRLGILTDDRAVMTGPELARLSDEEFADRVEHVRVYARRTYRASIRSSIPPH